MGLYYIGLASNNAVGNNFDATITLYPTKELNNIYYSDNYISDTNNRAFFDNYMQYIKQNCYNIKEKDANSHFLCFNKKIKELCNNIDGINVVGNSSDELVEKLNNKKYVREMLSKTVPTLEYMWLDNQNTNYNDICKKIGNNSFVLQGKIGAGGDNTFLITNKELFDKYAGNLEIYCISRYIEHIPLNITCIIGKYNSIFFSPSVQLIQLCENRLKYVGGDFVYPKLLKKNILDRVYEYSNVIAKKISEKGYLGILGIDYILDKNGNIYFMEFNPRFQSSTFLLNEYLRNNNLKDVGHLHFDAICEKKLPSIYNLNIEESFLNCNLTRDYLEFECDSIYEYGYCEFNRKSYYRKLYKKSIINEGNFEKIKKLTI